jgi:hypothetical protein
MISDENMRQLNTGLGLDDGISGFYMTVSQLPVTSNQALIQYFAKLGQSQNSEETIDLEEVNKLLSDGANINCTDRHGQTVLHEVRDNLISFFCLNCFNALGREISLNILFSCWF